MAKMPEEKHMQSYSSMDLPTSLLDFAYAALHHLWWKIFHSVTRQCIHCCKGDTASQWEMAILGVSELEPID